MKERVIDDELRLIPYYRNDAVSLPWYQDPELCRQVEGRAKPYDLARLHCMYDYLCAHGDCYYIEYRGVPVGDITLKNDGEIAIVICKGYQNRHIGRKCVQAMLNLAREKKMDAVRSNIYSFNTRSERMFKAAGFEKIADEWYKHKV